MQYYFVLVLGGHYRLDSVVRQSHTLLSDPPSNSSAQLAPFLIITILLAIFSMPYFTSP